MDRRDVELLERFRARLLARRSALLHRHLPGRPRSDLAQAVGAAPGVPIQVCAWCLHARSEGGRWRPVGHLVPFDGPHEIERCMCDACASPVEER